MSKKTKKHHPRQTLPPGGVSPSQAGTDQLNAQVTARQTMAISADQPDDAASAGPDWQASETGNDAA